MTSAWASKLSTRGPGLERGLLHQLPARFGEQCGQGLGLTKEEYKKIGVKFAYMRSTPLNDWYPHYIHNLDNLIRFGGLFPPIEVTRMSAGPGCWASRTPAEGGVMMVRAKDDIYRMTELKGKKIGISKSMNTDQERLVADSGAPGD
jgi:hypothetical protein